MPSNKHKTSHHKTSHHKTSHHKTSHHKTSHKTKTNAKKTTTKKFPVSSVSNILITKITNGLSKQVQLTKKAMEKIIDHIQNDTILPRLDLRGAKVSVMTYEDETDYVNIVVGPRDFTFDSQGNWIAQGTMVSDAKWKKEFQKHQSK